MKKKSEKKTSISPGLNECERCKMLSSNAGCMEEALYEMGDRIRGLHDEMLRLQTLLVSNGISFKEEE